QPLGKSFYGSPGSWVSWTYGEFFTAVSVRQLAMVEEVDNSSVEFDITEITNPKKEIRIKWQVPKGMWVRISLNDVTGRVVKYFYKNAENTSQKGIITLDNKTLSKGVYLLHFETPAYKKTKKVVLF
ncbi:MAG: T9SS type A sorting domain-containing protein, partial [candidate division WOR-3 bacterium]